MNLLRKLKNKWRKNQEAKDQKLSPEILKWGYEVALESYLEIMEPNNWGVREKGDKWQLVFKDKRWYSDYADTSSPGLFSNESKAWEAIGKIIEKAAKDFDDTVKEIKQLPDA